MTTFSKLATVTEDKGVEGVKARLAEERDHLLYYERMAKGTRRRRDALIVKLAEAGLPERSIAPLAGISNVGVHHVIAAYRAASEKPETSTEETG